MLWDGWKTKETHNTTAIEIHLMHRPIYIKKRTNKITQTQSLLKHLSSQNEQIHICNAFISRECNATKPKRQVVNRLQKHKLIWARCLECSISHKSSLCISESMTIWERCFIFPKWHLSMQSLPFHFKNPLKCSSRDRQIKIIFRSQKYSYLRSVIIWKTRNTDKHAIPLAEQQLED